MNSTYTALGITPQSVPPAGFDVNDIMVRSSGESARGVSSLALDVAGLCNLACRYCVEAASALPDRPPMREDVLDDALRLLDAHSTTGLKPSIRIGSGEPLLALSLLRRLRKSLADSISPAEVFVTTNGTLIDDATADWLATTGWWVKISLDGPRQVHDTWRCDRQGKGTYEHVARAVRLMVERAPERTSVAAVLARGADPAEVFEAIASLGVSRIELLPVAHRPTAGTPDIRPTPEDVGAYLRFIDGYARRVARDGPEAHPTLVRFEESVRKVMGYGNAPVPCGAGRTFVCVGSDRVIYPCFRFAGATPYAIGDLDHGVDDAASSRFRTGAGRTTHNRTACATCWGAALCGGPCFAVAEFIGEDGGLPQEHHCLYKLADVRAAFGFVTHLQKHCVERLVPFLPLKPDPF